MPIKEYKGQNYNLLVNTEYGEEIYFTLVVLGVECTTVFLPSTEALNLIGQLTEWLEHRATFKTPTLVNNLEKALRGSQHER